MSPGQSVLIVISGASSRARVLASPMTPAQVATDRPKPAIGSMAESAVMLTTLPAPRAFMCGTAARTQRTDAHQVLIDGPAPGVVVEIGEGAEGRRPVVVDEDVDAAEPLDRPVDDAKAVLGAAHVALHRDDFAARLVHEPAHGFLEGGSAPRRRDDPRAFLGAACGQERPSHAASLDVRIRNALVVDGTGAPAYRGDLGIRDGRFVPPDGEALRELNADGLVAAPGFVDIHSHGDLVLASGRPDRETLIAGRLAQGITTEVIGNCGLGAAPLFGDAHDLAPAVHAWMTPEGADWRWKSLADYFSVLETRGLPLNVAALVPHGLLRLGAMGLRPGAPDAGNGPP